MANSQKEQVAAFYEAHHSRGKYDYLYGGEDRKELFVQLVGTAIGIATTNGLAAWLGAAR
jgi:hypothetical protein